MWIFFLLPPCSSCVWIFFFYFNFSQINIDLFVLLFHFNVFLEFILMRERAQKSQISLAKCEVNSRKHFIEHIWKKNIYIVYAQNDEEEIEKLTQQEKSLLSSQESYMLQNILFHYYYFGNAKPSFCGYELTSFVAFSFNLLFFIAFNSFEKSWFLTKLLMMEFELK